MSPGPCSPPSASSGSGLDSDARPDLPGQPQPPEGAVASMAEAFLTLDREWRFTYLNAAGARLLRKTPAQLLGTLFWAEFPQSQGLQGEHERAFADSNAVEFEEHHRPLNCWIGVRACPWAQGLAVSLRDITDHRKAQHELAQLNAGLEKRLQRRTAELKEAAQDMEAFAYSIAHDLRSPIGVVAGYCQALEEKEGAQLTPRGRHFLARIRAAAGQMDTMTEGLLALARLSHTAPHRQVVNLAPLAQQLLDNFRMNEPERRVEVEVMGEIWAEGDVVLVTQVLGNLLSNAWKFTRKLPLARIEVGMKMGGDDLPVYFVKDNGAGFDKAHAGKLFQAFQRLHLVSEFEGTGVGLATVSKIISRHGGRIWAEAEPGAGATFYFTLSTGPEDEAADPRPA